MNFYGITDVGNRRPNNEDNYLEKIYDTNFDKIGLFAVTDGIGGHSNGEMASLIAVKEIESFFDNSLRNISSPITQSDAESMLCSAMYRANYAIYSKSADQKSQNKMGTTCVIALIVSDHAYIANIGDSRAYLYSNKDTKKLTMDNSYVEELLERGEINEKEAQTHDKRNILTRAVGIEPIVKTDLYNVSLQKGDILMLCSDGLTSMVGLPEINQVLNEELSIEEKVTKLKDISLIKGGYDNITIICIEM